MLILGILKSQGVLSNWNNPSKLSNKIELLEAAPATLEEIALVHTPRMITALEAACEHGPGIIDFAPTYVTKTSFSDALNAAGGTLACTRAVLNGEAKNAFAIVHPPGH